MLAAHATQRANERPRLHVVAVPVTNRQTAPVRTLRAPDERFQRRIARKLVARAALRYASGDPAGKVDVVCLKLGVGRSHAARLLSTLEPDEFREAHLCELERHDAEAARAIRDVDTWSYERVLEYLGAGRVAA